MGLVCHAHEEGVHQGVVAVGVVVVLHHVHPEHSDAAAALPPRQRRHPGRRDRRGVRRVRIELELHRVHAAPLRIARDHLGGITRMADVPRRDDRGVLHARGEVPSPRLGVPLVDPQPLGAGVDRVPIPRGVRVQRVDRAVHDDEVVHGQDAAGVMASPQPQRSDQCPVHPRK